VHEEIMKTADRSDRGEHTKSRASRSGGAQALRTVSLEGLTYWRSAFLSSQINTGALDIAVVTGSHDHCVVCGDRRSGIERSRRAQRADRGTQNQDNILVGPK